MCVFFSLVSNSKTGDIFYSDWHIRKDFLAGKLPTMESPDSHSSIAAHFG